MPPPPCSSAPSRLLPSLSLYSRRTIAAAATSPAPAGGHGRRPLRYAILGAGFAGLSVAWHLLKHSPRDSRVSVDIYDEKGVGGGASGVSGGLLHPYSPKVKLLWRGAEFWKESMDLLRSAEQANGTAGADTTSQDERLIWRRGIVRPPTTEKAADILLEALFSACQNLADEASSLPNEQKEFKLYRQHVDNLHQLAVSIGSTWQWKSENYSSTVSDEEALTAKDELLPKASGVYPGINEMVGKKSNCKFWLVGGLGARGLLYHGLVGKLTAKAAICCDENVIPSEFTCWKGIKPSQ
ncbi:hypothetical protein SETIT_4G051500v2 [Setaria italica]|uniref:FAD dependent oxidoreductase domain-containing protein n=1 Tax=Setaria italica TaxID=4555 RepID=A0A368QRJ4_SETIT|nr:hypothetical protein SETIT_4G051500v2 [Setaria italica]